MSRSKLVLLLAFLLLMTVPVTVSAQSPAEGAGTAIISDDAALSDSITVSMSGVTAPAEGSAYEGWLVSDDGSTKLSTGVMTVGADGSISHTFGSASDGYTGENLIASYSSFIITEEPSPDTDPMASDTVVFNHVIPSGGMAHIRHLLTDWPAGSGVGILTNLKTQLDVAIQHAELAASSETLEDVQKHVHHVINAIEGESGANYDASFGTFGDGVGVLTHAQDSSHAGFAAAGAPDDTVVAAHAALVETNGASVETRATSARDIALKAAGANSLRLAKILVGPGGGTVISTLKAARNGFDGDGDGTIENTAGEAGADQAYVEAQLIATYTLMPGAPAPGEIATPEPTPEPTPAPTQPTAPGLPGVGDESVSVAAQFAMMAGVLLLGAGGIFVIRGRRSKNGI